jgi:hypothetical protein
MKGVRVMKISGTARGPGYEFTQLGSPNFLTKLPKLYNGEKTASLKNVGGKSGYLPAEN